MEEKRRKATSCWDEGKGVCLIWDKLAALPPPSGASPRSKGWILGKVGKGVKEGGEVWAWRISEGKIFGANDTHLLIISIKPHD